MEATRQLLLLLVTAAAAAAPPPVDDRPREEGNKTAEVVLVLVPTGEGKIDVADVIKKAKGMAQVIEARAAEDGGEELTLSTPPQVTVDVVTTRQISVPTNESAAATVSSHTTPTISMPTNESTAATVSSYTTPSGCGGSSAAKEANRDTISMPTNESTAPTVSSDTTPSVSGRSSAAKEANRDQDEDREGLTQVQRKDGENLTGRKRDQFNSVGDLVAKKLRFLQEKGHKQIMTKLENGIYKNLQEANEELRNADTT